MIKTQVCIIGAGAGGVGCAYRLIKNGINTVVIDRKNIDFGLRNGFNTCFFDCCFISIGKNIVKS